MQHCINIFKEKITSPSSPSFRKSHSNKNDLIYFKNQQLQRDKISKEISKYSNNGNGQLPSKERFKELLLKLEKEYELLWEENQELKLKCGLIGSNSNNKPSTASTGSAGAAALSLTSLSAQNIQNNQHQTTTTLTAASSSSVGGGGSGKHYNNNPYILSESAPPIIGSGLGGGGKSSGKFPKMKKSSSKQSKSINPSKRDGSHKWIRAREYTGHRDGIWEVTACPWDIMVFATSSTDRTARIWTVDGSKIPIVYTAHTGTVNSIRFHPQERFVCTASGDKTLHIFKLPAERNSQGGVRSPGPYNLQSLQNQLNNVQLSSQTQSNSPLNNQQHPNSPILLSKNENLRVKLWTPLLERQKGSLETQHTQQPTQQQQQQQHQQQYHLDNDYYNDDSPNNLSDDQDEIDFESNQMYNNTAFQPPHSPSSVHGVEEPNFIDFNSFNNNNNTQQQQQQLQQPPQLQQQQINNPTTNNQQGGLLNLNSEQPSHIFIRSPSLELKGHTGPVIGATWISGSMVVSASWDNTIRWWNTETGKVLAQTNIGPDKVHRVTNLSSIPNTNTHSITSSTDGVIRLWDFRSSLSGCIDSIHGHQEPVNSAVFTSDGNHIVSGGDDRTVKVWDIRQSKTCKTSIRCPFAINRLSVSPGTSIIAIPQDDGRISVYDVNGNRKGKMRDQYKYGHKLMASSTAWSYDDSVIFSSGFDRKADTDTYQYIPFSDREEWKDITPVPQDDGPHPICPIAYTQEFIDKMNYFRAILIKQEKSLRVLQLLEEVAEDNSSNYTVWYYRREVLKHIENDSSIEYDINDEMELLNELGEADPKNYQIWNHRRFIVEKYIGPSQELDFLEDVLDKDAKNYHAWAHRQWLVKTYDLWDGELEYVDKLLKKDHRNNSAWNHRFFILSNKNTLPFSPDLIEKEIQYSMNHIKHSPNNESPWNYLAGLFKGQKFSVVPTLLPTLCALKERYIGCIHVNSLIIDIYEEENTKESLEKNLKICLSLANNIDQLHKKYWMYRHSVTEQKLIQLGVTNL
eukprot:gene3174-3973_t